MGKNFFKSIKIQPTKSEYKTWLVFFKRRVSIYKTLNQNTYYTSVNGFKKITIPKGFKFDGASIPRIVWTIAGYPFDTDVLGGALVHDYLYRYKIFDRKTCDLILLEALTSSGTGFFKRFSYYISVRVGGSRPYKEIFISKK